MMMRDLSIKENFWDQMVTWMSMCSRQYNDSTTNIASGILDETHMKYLIRNDVKLKDKITVITDEYETMKTTMIVELIEHGITHCKKGTYYSHAFVIGCTSHWISAVVGSTSDKSKVWVAVTDSQNKPYLGFLQHASGKIIDVLL